MPRTNTRLIVVLSVAAAAAVGIAASAVPALPISVEITGVVEAIDANENAGVDRDEWRKAGQITFRTVDSDKDGQISRAEFTFLHGAMFAAIDADRDGVMTAEEIDGYKRLPWTLGIAH